MPVWTEIGDRVHASSGIPGDETPICIDTYVAPEWNQRTRLHITKCTDEDEDPELDLIIELTPRMLDQLATRIDEAACILAETEDNTRPLDGE